jgi:hypothetical protein
MSNISKDLDRISRNLRTVPKQFYEKFRAETPVRSGYARNNTRLAGDTVNANYAYAGPLNKGASRKAPQGMTIPTIKYIRQVVRNILGK